MLKTLGKTDTEQNVDETVTNMMNVKIISLVATAV